MPNIPLYLIVAAAIFFTAAAFAGGAGEQAPYSEGHEGLHAKRLQSEVKPVDWSTLIERAVVYDVYVHPQSKKAAIAEQGSKPSRQYWSGPTFRIDYPRFSIDVNALNFEPSFGFGWAHALKIRDPDEGPNEVTVEIPDGAVVADIAWSPTGKWLSFVVRINGNLLLWVASADDGKSFQVSKRPINRFVDGQSSSSLRMPFYEQYVPYAWLSDESGIVFASKDPTVRFSQEEWSSVDVRRANTSGDKTWIPTKQYSGEQVGALRQTKLSKVYSADLVYSSIEESDKEMSVTLRNGITHILARSAEREVSVATIYSNDVGEYHRQAQVVSFHDPSPNLMGRSRTLLDAPWNLYSSNSSDLIMITELSYDRSHCLIGVLVEDSENNPQLCFESSIVDIAESLSNLFVLLSDNSAIRVSKRDLSVSKILPLSEYDVGSVRWLRQPGGMCTAATKGTAFVESTVHHGVGRVAARGSQGSFRNKILELDFDRASASLVGELVDDSLRNVSTGYVMCDGAPILSQESFSSPKNYFIHRQRNGDSIQLTEFQDVMPELANWKRFRLSYERSDNIPLSADVILPPTKKRMMDGKYPAVVWQYPRHVSSKSEWEKVVSQLLNESFYDATRFAYRRGRASAGDGVWNEYLRPISENYIGNWLPLALAYDGYAVVAYPDMPLIGKDGNDKFGTFSNQLTLNAEALVDAIGAVGVIDKKRIAIGGHSRGSTVTSQLLAETDLFAAGFGYAGPSSFNSQLFGFQYEERTYWEYPEAYVRNGPIFNADRINEPLLSMYGEQDDFPTREQGEDLHRVLVHIGKISKLVVYPEEKHVPRYRETQLSILEEVSEWLDTHMVN